MFSVGLVRDPAIEYIIADDKLQDRSVYFWSSYETPADAVRVTLNDGLHESELIMSCLFNLISDFVLLGRLFRRTIDCQSV